MECCRGNLVSYTMMLHLWNDTGRLHYWLQWGLTDMSSVNHLSWSGWLISLTCPTSWYWLSPASPVSVAAGRRRRRPSPSPGPGPGRSPCPGATRPAGTATQHREHCEHILWAKGGGGGGHKPQNFHRGTSITLGIQIRGWQTKVFPVLMTGPPPPRA